MLKFFFFDRKIILYVFLNYFFLFESGFFNLWLILKTYTTQHKHGYISFEIIYIHKHKMVDVDQTQIIYTLWYVRTLYFTSYTI